MSPQQRVGDAVTSISENSNVRLGLALALLSGVVWLVSTIKSLETQVASWPGPDRLVTRDYLTSQLDLVRERQESARTIASAENQALRAEMARILDRLERLDGQSRGPK